MLPVFMKTPQQTPVYTKATALANAHGVSGQLSTDYTVTGLD